MAHKYQIAEPFQQMCSLLQIDSQRVTRRAGLPDDWWQQANSDVSAPQYFALWAAAKDESGSPDCDVVLAKSYARGPFSPPVFAFSCADTLALGLQRLSDFKPLLGPMTLTLERDETSLTIVLGSAIAGVRIPESIALFELAYIIECTRLFSGKHIIPNQLTLAAEPMDAHAFIDHMGIVPKITGVTSFSISHRDADLILITRSPALWDSIEPMLSKQLGNASRNLGMAARVQTLLPNCLPGGCTNAEGIARRLNTSKRTLQRNLNAEGTSLNAIMKDVRKALALRYLTDTNISVPEISHLLGFRDTSSFFRAFHSWTGKTPGDVRETGTRS